MTYNEAFERAVDHSMLYEVGGFWNSRNPAIYSPDLLTRGDRRATGYVNDPVDAGGETKFGIAKRANPKVNIARLTWPEAKAIYFDKYWIAGKCPDLPPQIAIIHFDACINHGVGRAGRMLQESVGATIDGIVGRHTIAAAIMSDQEQTVKRYAQIRRDFYRAIVRNKPSQARFINGWMRRIDEVEAHALS